MRRGLLPSFFSVLALISNVQAQRGTITQPRNLVQLIDHAAIVVHGRVIQARVETHPQYRNLSFVLVTMSVENVLKGTAGKTFSFRQFIWDPRDRVDRGGYHEGEELLLFMNRVTAAGFTSPVGLEQGRFWVLREAHGERLVVNGVNNRGLSQGTQELSAAPSLSPGARQALATPAGQLGPIRLSVMKELVRAMADGRRGTQ